MSQHVTVFQGGLLSEKSSQKTPALRFPEQRTEVKIIFQALTYMMEKLIWTNFGQKYQLGVSILEFSQCMNQINNPIPTGNCWQTGWFIPKRIKKNDNRVKRTVSRRKAEGCIQSTDRFYWSVGLQPPKAKSGHSRDTPGHLISSASSSKGDHWGPCREREGLKSRGHPDCTARGLEHKLLFVGMLTIPTLF